MAAEAVVAALVLASAWAPAPVLVLVLVSVLASAWAPAPVLVLVSVSVSVWALVPAMDQEPELAPEPVPARAMELAWAQARDSPASKVSTAGLRTD